MDHPRVLVVDDDADVGEFLRDALSSWSYDVTRVASGREAVAQNPTGSRRRSIGMAIAANKVLRVRAASEGDVQRPDTLEVLRIYRLGR